MGFSHKSERRNDKCLSAQTVAPTTAATLGGNDGVFYKQEEESKASYEMANGGQPQLSKGKVWSLSLSPSLN